MGCSIILFTSAIKGSLPAPPIEEFFEKNQGTGELAQFHKYVYPPPSPKMTILGVGIHFFFLRRV